jgi:hypothetical protein
MERMPTNIYKKNQLKLIKKSIKGNLTHKLSKNKMIFY